MKTQYDLTYISLGLGRQSSGMGICSALGLRGIPRADCAIFADTGDEVLDTYRHLDVMREFLGKYGIPLHIVRQGHLGKELVGMKAKARRGYIVSIPAFTEGEDGKEGRLRRQCTQEYKIIPIERKVREFLGFRKGDRIAGKKKARALVGISVDEIWRAKPSRVKWIDRYHPLLDAGMRTEDCARICLEHLGYVPVKSACRYCPYHDDGYWSWLRRERPEEFEKACQVDRGVRNLTRAGVARPVFLHRSLKPLEEVDFDAPKEPGQLTLGNQFLNDCEGYCGV